MFVSLHALSARRITPHTRYVSDDREPGSECQSHIPSNNLRFLSYRIEATNSVAVSTAHRTQKDFGAFRPVRILHLLRNEAIYRSSWTLYACTPELHFAGSTFNCTKRINGTVCLIVPRQCRRYPIQ